jgi:hypothetical protein
MADHSYQRVNHHVKKKHKIDASVFLFALVPSILFFIASIAGSVVFNLTDASDCTGFYYTLFTELTSVCLCNNTGWAGAVVLWRKSNRGSSRSCFVVVVVVRDRKCSLSICQPVIHYMLLRPSDEANAACRSFMHLIHIWFIQSFFRSTWWAALQWAICKSRGVYDRVDHKSQYIIAGFGRTCLERYLSLMIEVIRVW